MELTNDEAIKILETMLNGIDNKSFFVSDAEKMMAFAIAGESLRMAIEALKSKESN